jgi:hypothetical protein
MSRIFICYSRKDQEFKERLLTSLTKHNFETWVDSQNISVGDYWSDKVQEGLEKSDIMLVIISPDSMKSRPAKDEWEYFLDKGKPIIPVLWNDAERHHRIHSLHYVDFSRQDFDVAFAELQGELRAKGINPTPTTGKIPKNKMGNAFWLCHDLLELHRYLREDVSKEWIDIGFRQSLHHAKELSLDEIIVVRLQEIITLTSPFRQEEWTVEERIRYSMEVRRLFNTIAQRIQRTDPDFDPGPG